MKNTRALLAILATVLLVAWAAREVNNLRFHRLPGSPDESAAWFSAEPDGLYHLRRVERMFDEGLPPAQVDPRMNHPEGAMIPWPSYYDALAYVLLKPFAPADPVERRIFLEQALSTLPMLFGILTSLLVAAAAGFASGRAGALFAGTMHASCWGAVHYSLPGIADHHALIALLMTALYLVFGEALRRRVLSNSLGADRFGLAAGILAGVLIGTWTAALIQVGVIQLVLLGLAWRDRKKPMPGLGIFGASFHMAALVALMPAVSLSPWKEAHPWLVVNLSWFHPTWLLVGTIFFLPFVFLKESSAARKSWPKFATFGGVALLAVTALLDWGPASGLREGLEWAARGNTFMADIAESQPLLGSDEFQTGGLFGWLGFGVLWLPLAWAHSRERTSLLPWLVAAPIFLVQAMLQRRFADVASVPLAILVGVWVASRLKDPSWKRLVPVCGFALLLNYSTLLNSVARFVHQEEELTSIEAVRQNGYRSLHEWLAGNAPKDSGVLAHWDQGHAIESVARLGSVATNFGIYVGEDSFRAPAAFFTSQDWGAAREILDDHDANFVLVHSMIPSAWGQLQAAAGGRRVGWSSSLVASLSHSGGPPPSPYLRLVFVSPYPESRPDPRWSPQNEISPSGYIWERVSGAQLVVAAEPGTPVTAQMRISYKSSGYAFEWSSSALADKNGLARVRVPYSTEASMGDASSSNAVLRIGEKSQTLQVLEEQVRSGSLIQIR
ncbi:MAG: hypothetical protein QGH51_02240 [Planctomycetota bacterium]|jgi:asparagine N-glycosylation enzyme membrane subunit Stt3|nr:hypothetical protein [Planctomycetota bacterium]